MNSAPRILVTNVHSTRNAGDQVLLRVALQELYRSFPGCTITVATNDCSDYTPTRWEGVVGSFTHWFRDDQGAWRCARLVLAPWLLLRAVLAALLFRCSGRAWLLPRNPAQADLVRAYMGADLVVSCPGNFLISDHGRGVFLALTIFALAYAWLLGKPLYMLPQTVGPLRRPLDQRVVRWLLGRMRLVLVRDETSLATLAAIGLDHPRCHLLPDLAFLFQGDGDLAPLCDLLDAHDRLPRPLLGVTVINWRGHDPFHARPEAYEGAIVAALRDFLSRHGGTVILFPQVCGPSVAEDDRPPARRIASQLRRAGLAAYAIEYEMRPGQLQAAYGQMDLFMGTRLHSNIFAMTVNTPVMAVAYQYKTHGVMQMLGLSEWVIDIDQVNDARLTAALEALWQRRAAIRAHLSVVLPELQHQTHAAAAMIRADFQQLRQ